MNSSTAVVLVGDNRVSIGSELSLGNCSILGSILNETLCLEFNSSLVLFMDSTSISLVKISTSGTKAFDTAVDFTQKDVQFASPYLTVLEEVQPKA
jgi:hypothetical protein